MIHKKQIAPLLFVGRFVNRQNQHEPRSLADKSGPDERPGVDQD